MKDRQTASAVVLIMILACGQAPSPADLGAVLAEAGSTEGWRIVEGPHELDPDTLYEYLDGGASLYHDCGFRQLLHVRYQHGDEFLAAVTLDVYDMGSELGAFGIFSSGRSPESTSRAWGGGGYSLGNVAAFWKDRYFVHGEADDDRADLLAMLDRLMDLVSGAIEGRTSLPAALGPLPFEHRVPRSEMWVARDLLGHDFLPEGGLATYEIEGRSAQLFFSDIGNAASAEEAFSRLRAHQARWGEIVGETDSVGDAGFRYAESVAGRGTVVLAGRYVVGAHGDLDHAAQERLLTALISRLDSPMNGN